MPIVSANEESVAGTDSPPSEVSGAKTMKGRVDVQELARIERTIARRMVESTTTVPDFALVAEVEMGGCIALRAGAREAGSIPVPSFNDIVVKACGLALRDHPRANGSYVDGRFELYSRVNVGIAVASKDTLVVPTIFDADQKPLRHIAEESRALADRVRAGRITAAELGGGTFTVSNLGMYGIRRFTAVINPPQAAILAVGAIVPSMFVEEGRPVVRYVMDVTLSCDHRILYGASAAEFLSRIRSLLEQPDDDWF